MTTNGVLKEYRKTIIAITQAIDALADVSTTGYSLDELGERQQQFSKLHEVKRHLEAVALQIQKGGDAT